MVVLAVERLEAFAPQHLVELCKRAGAIGTFVESICRAHELVDEATEELRMMAGAAVGLGQHLL